MNHAMHKSSITWCWAAVCCVGLGALLPVPASLAGDGDSTPPVPTPETPAAPENPIRSSRGSDTLDRVPRVGDNVRITFADRRVIEGTLVEILGSTLQVKVSGATVKITLADGDLLQTLETPQDRYTSLRALIPDDDVDRLLALTAWLQRQGMYEQALKEVNHVLRIDPTNSEALRQKRVLEPLIEVRSRKSDNAEDPVEMPNAPIATRPGPGEFPLLSREQVNLIKLYEVDLKAPPRILVKRETIDKLLVRHADNPLIPSTREGRDAFRKLAPAQILDTMFRVQARDLYPEVEVLDNPRSMEFFRDRMHATWIVNVMATTRCHGGSESGRLKLYNRRPAAEESFYTNFLILDRFVTQDGQRLINYEQPERSLLLQYGLNRSDATSPHPIVEGWQPAFLTRDSRRFKQAAEWIRMLYRPRPEYPVDYSPPGEAEAPRPIDTPEQTPR